MNGARMLRPFGIFALATLSFLAAQGTGKVPVQERLVLAKARTGALQALTLPYGGQVVQVFWTRHIKPAQLHSVPRSTLAQLLAFHKRLSAGPSHNASVFQQDEWMLEGHANLLFDGPVLPSMCYGQCSSLNGAPHISAAILHGIAYTESNWHQFNSPDYQVNGETVGTPVESWDGGWVKLKLFDHQLAGAGGAAPVDAVEAIAGLVIANGRHVRRDMIGAALNILPAGQLGAGQYKAG